MGGPEMSIRIEYKNDKYFINGKEVVDELEFEIKTRLALAKFKVSIEEGMKVQSRIYTDKDVQKETD